MLVCAARRRLPSKIQRSNANTLESMVNMEQRYIGGLDL